MARGERAAKLSNLQWEYWSRRPGSNGHGCEKGRLSKQYTHQAERVQTARALQRLRENMELGETGDL